MVMVVFRPEAQLTLFLRMRTEEIAKTRRECIPTEELFPCYRKWGSPKRTARSANCNKTANINVKTQQFETMFSGDTAYITQKTAKYACAVC